jgi:hypothetical protein
MSYYNAIFRIEVISSPIKLFLVDCMKRFASCSTGVGFLLLPLAFLVGCAPLGPTPYQPADPVYGYAEQSRGKGLIEVRFTGDPDTPFEFYTLYRAAELTVAQGNNGFEILSSSIEMGVRETAAPSMRPRVRYPSHSQSRGIFFYESQPSQLRGKIGEQWDEFAYTAFLVFRPFTAPSFPEGPLRYDARNVLKWLDHVIVRPRTNPR